MTFKEFNNAVLKIQNEKFESRTEHPLEAGIRRASFNESKLERLVVLAEQVSFATAKRRGEAWARQLERVRQARSRFEKMRAELAKQTAPAAHLPRKQDDRRPSAI